MEPRPMTPTSSKGKKIQSMGMTFPEAMRHVIEGEMIKRLSWEPEFSYCLLKDDYLTVFIKGEFRVWKVNESDLRGTDWVVMKQPN